MHGKRKQRSRSGLAVAAMLSFIAVLVIGPLSFFVFELSQYNLAAQQLKNCLDSAALAAACSTTGSNSSSAAATQTAAMNAAMYMFQQNSILRYPLLSTPSPAAYGTSDPTWSPVANQAQLYFEFLDPVTKTPVPYGSPNGKILRVFGSWGFIPTTAKFTGLAPGPYVISDRSDGGLPELDVILCFDISSSMDDFTNVSLVNRSTDATDTSIIYSLPGTLTPVTDPASGISYKQQGPLYYAVNGTNPLGLSINATYPMDVNSSGSGNEGTYSFNAVGHGAANVGPPTQTVTANATASGGLSFTDCVVNLDGTAKQSSGITLTTSNGAFTFPADDASHKGLGILIEAMRGNLESAALASAAHVPYAAWGITPRAGWFQAYYEGVMSAQTAFPTGSVSPLRHPIGDAIAAAENFFSILNNDADVHFGLVTFSSAAGSSPSSSVGGSYGAIVTNGSIATGSEPSQPCPVPNPAIFLNPNAGPTYSNYSTAVPPPQLTSVNGAMFTAQSSGAITTLVAEGGTNIQQALDAAIAMHLGSKSTDPNTTPLGRGKESLGRAGATRAIVLFTDGLPNSAPDFGTSDPQCQAEANFAGTIGIPIYTIGLCMVPALQANQATVLGDMSTSPTQGIAALSKNGATFTQTTSAAGLNAVFQNVARQLVQLVQ